MATSDVDTGGAAGVTNARIGREAVAALARGDADGAMVGLAGLQAPAGSSLVSASAMAITDHRGEVGGGTTVTGAVDGNWQTLHPVEIGIGRNANPHVERRCCRTQYPPNPISCC